MVKKHTAEHPSHQGLAPPRKTLLAVDLPHSKTPYSLWTCPTMEHPTPLGPSQLQNTLLTLDLPHTEHPNHSTEEDLQKMLRGCHNRQQHTDIATYRVNRPRGRCSEKNS